MIYYTLLYFSAILIALAHDKLKLFKGVLFFLLYFLLVVFLGTREESVGRDTAQYVKHIGLWDKGAGNNFEGEPGLYLLFEITEYIGLPTQSFLFIVAALTIGLFLLSIRRFAKSQIFYPVAFFLTTFYIYAFSGIRQLLAVSMSSYAISILWDSGYQKLVLPITVLLLAMFVHNATAIVFPVIILSYFFEKTKKDFDNMFLYFSMTLFLASLFLLLAVARYGDLLVGIGSNLEVSSVLVFKILSFSIACRIIFSKLSGLKFFGHMLFFLYLSGLVLSVPGYFVDNLYRISYPFVFFEGIFYWRLSVIFRGPISKSLLMASLLLNFSLLLLDLVSNARDNIPYSSWLY